MYGKLQFSNASLNYPKRGHCREHNFIFRFDGTLENPRRQKACSLSAVCQYSVDASKCGCPCSHIEQTIPCIDTNFSNDMKNAWYERIFGER